MSWSSTTERRTKIRQCSLKGYTCHQWYKSVCTIIKKQRLLTFILLLLDTLSPILSFIPTSSFSSYGVIGDTFSSIRSWEDESWLFLPFIQFWLQSLRIKVGPLFISLFIIKRFLLLVNEIQNPSVWRQQNVNFKTSQVLFGLLRERECKFISFNNFI